MRLTIPELVGKNCYIYKLGFRYPICILNRSHHDEACAILSKSPQFGNPFRQYHFTTATGTPQLREFYNKKSFEGKWYAGPTKWNSLSKYDFWIAFKTDRDRTLALMMLQGK